MPEIQALRDIVENNPWHNNQSVFEHTKQVIKSLKQHTNNQLLLLATLFHDIAKAESLIQDGKSNTTMCPDHEAKGGVMMDTIGPEIGLTGDDLQYVKRIIEMHGLPHLLVNALMEHNNEEDKKRNFFMQTGLYAKDLLIHALADMEGSDLPRIDPVLFQKRKKIIEKLIKEC